MAEGIAGVGSVIVGGQFVAKLPERPAGDADAGGVEQFRKESEDIEAHGLLLARPEREGAMEIVARDKKKEDRLPGPCIQ